ncbi:alpha-glucan family phosphorylase [Mangrovibacterium diazotrophicum]|uniref:Starch phosphorylase n=1 Tax=Mangrovibacterium diazotrophicum TaxID=1261403 RepID=A0A419W8G5_9BACT|nr:alpha-glucan family phosphorylase [Mangrovibacterium diazotrophicum]RKD91746.1 starch phosphorylase [Mangrovibacterium diazotrophicum]
MEIPNWKKLFVESNIPGKLAPLKELSKNLWWAWNTDARELFEQIDPEIWEETAHNPIDLLDKVSYQRFLELEGDEAFINKMKGVSKHLQQYLGDRKELNGPHIAYFSMEYGLHDSLKIFSGGLGILAGDYLKEASDFKVNLVAVGLLYRYGYFKQTISIHGDQMANYDAQQFNKVPVQPALDADGKWIEVEVEYPGRNLKARLWEAKVGSISLYLLDADYEANSDEDRFVTHHLYGGDNENRLKQEMLLGLGGIRALRKLGFESQLYHCNEGHAAMIGLERMKDYLSETGLSFAEAKEVVRASTLFTTHTPVPAGHDSFHQDLFRGYMNFFAEKLGLTWDEFMMLGKSNPGEDHFNMSYLAANMSQGINGVSWLHGEVSKDILKNLYEGFLPEELNIGYVTNGVHYPTWTAKEWKELHLKYFGESFVQNQLDFDLWEKIYKVPDEEIWNTKKKLKLKMIDYIKERFADNWIKRHENPKLISEVLSRLDPNALTIGFARRFATYKRAHLLFRNLDRLSKIVNNPDRPVQFIFAGKAHPADKAGQDLIKYIIEISKRPEFLGKIIFVQNYDINLAKVLLQGVDIWLNTPTRPLEASGTSGEKGVMNGTIHFSVLDGWWVEGYKENAGWALPMERTYDVQDLQDELDAETIYNIFDDEIVPTYYDKNDKGYSEDWVAVVKNTIGQVAPNFTTTRMIRDYQDRFYNPQAKRYDGLVAEDYKLAKELAAWKAKVAAVWADIEVSDVQITDGINNALKIGESYPAKVVLDLKTLSSEDVGLEMVISAPGENGQLELVKTLEFEAAESVKGVTTYNLDINLMDPGYYNYGLRMFPKNEHLPHRQDFMFLKWL